MKRITKFTLFLALGLIVLGLGLYAAAVAQTGRLNYGPVETPVDYPKASATPITQIITDPVYSIQITDICSGIRILPSQDGLLTVECTNTREFTHKISVSDGVLRILVKETRTIWNRMFDFADPTQEIRVYLPVEQLDRLELSSVSGDVALLRPLSTGSLIVMNTSGDVSLESAATETLQATCVSGNLNFTNTSVSDFAELSTVSGNVRLEGFACNRLNAETVSGNVTGTIPEARSIRTETVSGTVYISENRSDAPIWEIATVSGDIHITVGS